MGKSGEWSAKGVVVRIRRVTDETVVDVGPENIGKTVASGDGLVWVDFDHTDESGMAMLPDLFDVHPADVADCHIRTPVPKLHRYHDHHYTAINGLARGADDRLYFVPLKVFQHPALVVTVLGPTSTALPHAAARTEISVVQERIDTDGFRPTTSLQLITAIRRAMMATLESLTGEAAGRIADFEKRCSATDPITSERLLDELFGMRHDLQTIRTSAAQAHQTYTGLLESSAEDGLLAIDEHRVRDLRQGFGQLVQTIDLEREYLQEMIDLFQTRVSTELNRFVRKVTAWGTVGIAWTVITGIYGMNVIGIPGMESPWGFPAVIGSMVVVAGVLALFFRRHGWL
jgi:magnesium transporter